MRPPKSSIEEVPKTQSCLRDLKLGRRRKCFKVMLQEDHLFAEPWKSAVRIMGGSNNSSSNLNSGAEAHRESMCLFFTPTCNSKENSLPHPPPAPPAASPPPALPPFPSIPPLPASPPPASPPPVPPPCSSSSSSLYSSSFPCSSSSSSFEAFGQFPLYDNQIVGMFYMND